VRVFYFLCLLFLSHSCFGQALNKVDKPPSFQVKQTSEAIVLDGILNEEFWNQAEVLSNFAQYSPTDSIPALGNTEIRMAYDDEYLYVSAKCYSAGNEFIVSSLKRDYSFGSTDNISFVFDTYNDKTNSFLLGMNPYGDV